MKSNIALVAAAASMAVCTAAHAESTEDRLAKLEQEIKILKRELEIEKEAAVADKAKQANVEYGKKGMVVTSGDGRAKFGIRGNAQMDARVFLDDENNTGRSEFLARRLRPIITAEYDDFSFRLMPDFAGGTAKLFDAHGDYKFADELSLRMGKFKAPLSLERLQSQTDLIFAERGFANNLAPSRDFGAMAYGEFSGGLAEYQLGVFNGNPDLSSADTDEDDKKDVVARVFVRPFKQTDYYSLQGLGVGVSGSVGERDGNAGKTILGDYRSPGQQRIFAYRTGTAAADTSYADGTQWRLFPQATYYYGPLGVMAEYGISDQEVTRGAVTDSLQHKAWEATVSYVLTGEDASYKGIVPKEPLNIKGGTWGAFELAARIGGIDFDDDSFPLFANPASAVTEAFGAGLGLNWYFNEHVKWQIDYDFTEFDGGAAAGADRPDEHALFNRLQYQF